MIQYWILFNLVISLYELYCYNNNNILGNSNIILNSWYEYSKVDPRYIIDKYKYVWNFELLNVANTILLTLAFLYKADNSYLSFIIPCFRPLFSL